MWPVPRSEEGAAECLRCGAPLDRIDLQQVAQQRVRVFAGDAGQAEGDLSGQRQAAVDSGTLIRIAQAPPWTGRRLSSPRGPGRRQVPGRIASRTIAPKDHMSEEGRCAAVLSVRRSESASSGGTWLALVAEGGGGGRLLGLRDSVGRRSSSFQAFSRANHTTLLGSGPPIARPLAWRSARASRICSDASTAASRGGAVTRGTLYRALIFSSYDWPGRASH